MAILKYLVVPKTVRYYQIGELNDNTPCVWFVLHGYGHLAEFFIRKFEPLNNGQNVIIAPEGMHRFYLNGSSGRVGASWMTKEDRSNDIKDYINYLNCLVQDVFDKVKTSNTKINILGFSQGGATASRWAMDANFEVNHLILFSSVFPPDLVVNPQKLKHIKKITAIMGNKDEYVSLNEFESNVEEWTLKGLTINKIIFDGTHEIKADTIKQLQDL